MKTKHIMLTLGIAAATAIAVPTISEATIYLMKGEKIVASYPDDAVDYITFDEPENPDIPKEYDVDTRSYFLNSNYYGDTQAASGYNYAVQFYDKPADDRGNIPTDAMFYMIHLNGPEVADKKNPFIPEGTYTLGEAGSGQFTILSGSMSKVMYNGKGLTFKEAWLKVSKNAAKWKYEFTAVAEDDKTYHSVYDGTPNAYDQSIEWIDSDQHIQGGTVTAFYHDAKTAGDFGTNITIQIAENGYTDSGWLVKPGNYFTIIGNVDMDDRGNIQPGTWTVTNSGHCEKNTILAGSCINFFGITMPTGTNLQHWTNSEDVSVGLVKSGTMTVTYSKGRYTYTYDFTTDRNKKITGVFQGSVIVKNHPYELGLRLESDYTLDFSKNKKSFYLADDWSKELLLEISEMDSNSQYLGDRVELCLVPNNGVIELQPGIYKVTEDANSVGKIVPGTYTPQTGVGNKSVFVKYSAEEGGKVLKASGIKGGQVEVKKNADDTWTINYELLDEQSPAKHIRGTWTGNINN